MKKYILNPKLTMLAAEIAAYKELPDNMPDTALKAKQKELINSLYYQYITRHIDNQSYSYPLYKQEQKEKWPSGPRVKDHEAKRFIINQLVELNSERRKEMNSDNAASFFLASLNWRPSCQTVIKFGYQY